MIDHANGSGNDVIYGMTRHEAREAFMSIIAAATKQRETDKVMALTKERVERAAALPDAMEWEKERARTFDPRFVHSFWWRIEARMYADPKSGRIKLILNPIHQAIVEEPYQILDRIRQCANVKCGEIFWAGRATVKGKRVEGCGPACLNVLRLQRRDRPATDDEVKSVKAALLNLSRRMRRASGERWQFERTEENIADLAERCALPKARVKAALQSLVNEQTKKRATPARQR